MDLFCGDPLCKKPVELDAGAAEPWPVRCPVCRTHLYPRDILDASRPNDLEPKRGQLMCERDGRRIVVNSGELSAGRDERAEADVDRLLDMVTAQPLEAQPHKGHSTLILTIVAVVMLIIAVLLFA